MKNVSIKLFIIFTIFHMMFAHANCVEPKSVPQYGYGKLFYGGKPHTQPKIYPLQESLVYNSGSSQVAEEDNSPYGKNVSVFISEKLVLPNVVIDVKINNDSDALIAMPKKNIPNNEGLAGENFLINSDCIRLDYLGPLVNFGSHYNYPDDYISINPGSSYTTRIYLNEYYHFLPGEHHYNVEMLKIPILVKKGIGWERVVIRSNKISLKVDGLLLSTRIKSSYCSKQKCNASDVRWVD